MVEVGHLFIVTHTDLDGVGSAAAALIALGREPGEATVLYAEPYNLHEVLAELEPHVSSGDIVVISDLGPNRNSYPRSLETIKSLVQRGATVEWYDHHIWQEEEQEALKAAGARLVLDRSTCATGVVARYAPRLHGREPPGFLEELEKAEARFRVYYEALGSMTSVLSEMVGEARWAHTEYLNLAVTILTGLTLYPISRDILNLLGVENPATALATSLALAGTLAGLLWLAGRRIASRRVFGH